MVIIFFHFYKFFFRYLLCAIMYWY